MASADPTVPLQPRDQKGFSGLESPAAGEAGVWGRMWAGSGLGWEGKRPGAGGDALHARRKREQHCPPRDSCCWLGRVRPRHQHGKSRYFPRG